MYRDRDSKNLYFNLFRGEPIRLHWAGWHTDTYELQNSGWDFNASEEYRVEHHAVAVRIAATSPDGNTVLSGGFYAHPPMREYSTTSSFEVPPRIELNIYTIRDVFRTISGDELTSWQNLLPVDIREPSIASSADVRMRDFKFFQRRREAKAEIYIPPDNVDELFNKILKIQYPEQKEIKSKLATLESKPIIQAQVFSLAL